LPQDVVRDIEEFASRVKTLYPDAKVYLFGSFARGTWLRDSDVDVVVVSKHFEGVEFWKRYPQLRKLASERRAFDIVAYTPEELSKALERSAVIREASKYWVEVL
jgi:Nucleotidyltransferase domain.